VTVTNTGTATAYDATLSDPLPAGLAAPSAISGGGTFTAGAGRAGTINWTLPAIAPGGANALVYTFTTTLVSPSITTGATLSNTATTSTYDALPGGHASDPTRYPLYGRPAARARSPDLPCPRHRQGGVQRVGDRSGKPALRLDRHRHRHHGRPGEQRVGDRRPPGRMEL